MLTPTYRRHRPGSSRVAEIAERSPSGQAECPEDAWVGEDDVARDAAAGAREGLGGVQRVPAGLWRVRGERGLPVGGEVPHAPARPARFKHAAHEQAVVAAAPVPQRHRRHLQDRIVGEEPYQRRDISRLERAHIALDYGAYLRIARLGDFAHLAHVLEGSAG